MSQAHDIDIARDRCDSSAYQLADVLVLEVYRAAAQLPAGERFGLHVQLCRASVAVRSRIADAYKQPSERELLHFLAAAIGCALEVQYLICFAIRRGLIDADVGAEVAKGYEQVARALELATVPGFAA